MIKHNQNGAVSGVVISLVLAILLLIGAIAFGGWAYTSRQDYKDHSDAKSAVAAEAAVKEANRKKDLEFAETQKNPLKLYVGPDSKGSARLFFPKTWSGYVNMSDDSSTLEAYFNPVVVPSVENENNLFALRIEIISQSYAETLDSLKSQQADGKMQVSAYALPKLPKVVGVRATGLIEEKKQVDMVVLPLRSDTIKIWTEGDQYTKDFNTYILPNFSFSP